MFGHKQKMLDPKDGLYIFGPYDHPQKPLTMRIGIIGTTEGIERFTRWSGKIKSYIQPARTDVIHQKAFPGFQAAFNAYWPEEPMCRIYIPKEDINSCLFIQDRYQAVYETVGIFDKEIRRHLKEEDSRPDVWFVVIPEEIHKYCRPKSKIPTWESVPSKSTITQKSGRKLLIQPSLLFSEDNAAAQVYRYEKNFHNQLKARLLDTGAVIQIVRETSLTPEDFIKGGKRLRRIQDTASVAWNLSTTAYFKAGGRPWKIADIREGVCYIGLVFKIDTTSPETGNACCGAQMFLDSADGLVFKGAVGPWYSSETGEFHLSYDQAKELAKKVVVAYEREHGGMPKELFIHGKTYFNESEWAGFTSSVPKSTNLVGIRITDGKDIKLYCPNKTPVIRGSVYQLNKNHGYLWTRGFIPQLRTYAGREIPNPLDIQIDKGESNLLLVMKDILGLTKVNFNSCIFADGYPVTLRFADAVGEILTSAPISPDLPPLPFRHYI